MTDQHPITTPLELVEQWREQAPPDRRSSLGRELWLIDRAAQWGYDQRGEVNEAELQQARDEELEACCKWTTANFGELPGQNLHLFRRPKPPSLKKQALEALDEAIFMADDDPPEGICSDQADIIRRALEAIPDD